MKWSEPEQHIYKKKKTNVYEKNKLSYGYVNIHAAM